jgi:sulfur relay (sulfurtransferase) complex TusBCD TusD component (DsrE family)
MKLSTSALRMSHCIIHQEVLCYRIFFTEDEISNGHCGFNSGLHFLEEAGSKYEDAVHTWQ